MKLFKPFARLLCLSALLASLASCEQVDDILDPKGGDDKLQDLLTAGTWKVDSLLVGAVNNNVESWDPGKANVGTIVFHKWDETLGANYKVGLVEHRHDVTDTAGATRSVTDTLFWYPGTYGSLSLDGTEFTMFIGRHADDGSFDSESSIVMYFDKREKNLIRVHGRRAYASPNGTIFGFLRAYRLSR